MSHESHPRTSSIHLDMSRNTKRSRTGGGLSATLLPRDKERLPSRTADQNSRDEYQHPADDDLKRRLEERRIHETMADVGDGRELDRDHGDGDDGRGPEIGDEIGQRVTEAADGGHHPADHAAHQRRPAP